MLGTATTGSDTAGAIDDDVAATALRRVRNGDAAAIEALIARHADRVFRVALGITRNHADAQEVVQDVFITILRKPTSFAGRAALSSWIHRVATNAALNKRRGKRRDLETSLDASMPAFQADGHRAGDGAYVLADWTRNPEDELLAGESRATLEQAIADLPAHYRAVLTLRDVEGLTNEEVADMLGATVPCVKSRLHRARMAVRERLTGYWAAAR